MRVIEIANKLGRIRPASLFASKHPVLHFQGARDLSIRHRFQNRGELFPNLGIPSDRPGIDAPVMLQQSEQSIVQMVEVTPMPFLKIRGGFG